MSRAMIPSQQKLAEKLTILNDRGQGMLTRIYNIKKVIKAVLIDLKPVFSCNSSSDECFAVYTSC